LINCHTCLYGSLTSTYFNLNPPHPHHWRNICSITDFVIEKHCWLLCFAYLIWHLTINVQEHICTLHILMV
jgi:hypothetical protein